VTFIFYHARKPLFSPGADGTLAFELALWSKPFELRSALNGRGDAGWVAYTSQVVRLMFLYGIASMKHQFASQTLSIAELREQLGNNILPVPAGTVTARLLFPSTP